MQKPSEKRKGSLFTSTDVLILVIGLGSLVLLLMGAFYLVSLAKDVDVATLNATYAKSTQECVEATLKLDVIRESSRAPKEVLATCETANVKSLLRQGVLLLFALPLGFTAFLAGLFAALKRLGEVLEDAPRNLALARLEAVALLISACSYVLALRLLPAFVSRVESAKAVSDALVQDALGLIVIVTGVLLCVGIATWIAFKPKPKK